MRTRRMLVAVLAVVALAAPAASASPYNERCGDGTPHGCLQHCLVYHGGLGNLYECYRNHYLV